MITTTQLQAAINEGAAHLAKPAEQEAPDLNLAHLNLRNVYIGRDHQVHVSNGGFQRWFAQRIGGRAVGAEALKQGLAKAGLPPRIADQALQHIEAHENQRAETVARFFAAVEARNTEALIEERPELNPRLSLGDVLTQVKYAEIASKLKHTNLNAEHRTSLTTVTQRAQENREYSLKYRAPLIGSGWTKYDYNGGIPLSPSESSPEALQAAKNIRMRKMMTLGALASSQFNLGTAFIALSQAAAKLGHTDYRFVEGEGGQVKAAKDNFKDAIAVLPKEYIRNLYNNLSRNQFSYRVGGPDQPRNATFATNCAEHLGEAWLSAAEATAAINDYNFDDLTGEIKQTTHAAAGTALLKAMHEVATGIQQAAAELLKENYGIELNPSGAQEGPDELTPAERESIDTILRMRDFAISNGGNVVQAVEDVEAGKTDYDLFRNFEQANVSRGVNSNFMGLWRVPITDEDLPDQSDMQADGIRWEEVD